MYLIGFGESGLGGEWCEVYDGGDLCGVGGGGGLV